MPADQDISLNWVLSSLKQALARDSTQKEIMINQFVAKLENMVRVKTISAREATISQIEQYFQLKYDWIRAAARPWEPLKNSYRIPEADQEKLERLARHQYLDNNEYNCRLMIDIFVLNAKVQIPESSKNTISPTKQNLLSTPTVSSSPLAIQKATINMKTESDLSVTVEHPVSSDRVCFSGRVDYTWGYSYPGDPKDYFLVAVEAKKRSQFSTAESQLLTYLAILHEKRKRAEKKNSLVQGFYSDGSRFAFLAIKDDGTIEASRIYQALNIDDRDKIFSFITTILDAAVRSSPTVTPVKDPEQRDREIEHHDKEVWQHLFKTPEHDESSMDIVAEEMDGSVFE